jgi:predicted glycoside hydrolase/deacetylase ChbG (UPF0249 family)
MKICITCDDFGFSRQVSAGFFEAADKGIVKSCSVMPLTADKRDLKRLSEAVHISAGLHFSLTTLSDGPFKGYKTPLDLFIGASKGSFNHEMIYCELQRQYERLIEGIGEKVSHIDTHRHVHALPVVRKAIKVFAEMFNIPIVRYPVEVSPFWGIKKLLLNAYFYGEKPVIPFWGTSLMGDAFTPERIIRQLEFLEARRINASIWMVHLGYESPADEVDSYNLERETELKAMFELEQILKERAEICSMWDIL